MHSFRTHKTKFGINSGNKLILIFQLQFSTVILFELFYLVKYTVESPNNGHVGDMASVRCRELSASRRLLTIIIFVASYFRSTRFVRCRGVVRFSECPFWETPLYCIY